MVNYSANTSSHLDGPAYDAITIQTGPFYSTEIVVVNKIIPSEHSVVKRSTKLCYYRSLDRQ